MRQPINGLMPVFGIMAMIEQNRADRRMAIEQTDQFRPAIPPKSDNPSP